MKSIKNKKAATIKASKEIAPIIKTKVKVLIKASIKKIIKKDFIFNSSISFIKEEKKKSKEE